MGQSRIGKQSILYKKAPVITNCATVVGPIEGKGPLGNLFSVVKEDTMIGEASWEKAERKMLQEALNLSMSKLGLSDIDIDFMLAGDLLNQIISAGFAARDFSIPFFGLYGACSTLAEGLILASMLVDGGYAQNALVGVSSHHETAERQYRYPTEFGVQRYPSSQWTATGAAAYIVSAKGSGAKITCSTVGKVTDGGLKDPNDMGSAMAPAAADTIWQHFQDTGRHPADYDLILTGDLGKIGSEVLVQMLKDADVDITEMHKDCGILLYSEEQDVHAGGSGCACSAVVFGAGILDKINLGQYSKVLLVATGSLHSPLTWQQKESIPSIAHAVAVEAP